ncbi:MAG: hypothetical protein JXB05_04935 [Myxococcaceae bacterium]|nr:hypothetical protein [Myxococcaceae bacterium]
MYARSRTRLLSCALASVLVTLMAAPPALAQSKAKFLGPLDAANAQLAERRRVLAESFIEHLLVKKDSGGYEVVIPEWKKEHEKAFRAIAAGLWALKETAAKPETAAEYDSEKLAALRAQLPARLEQWTGTLYKYTNAGTSMAKGEGDYDFVMREMVSLLFAFKDDRTLLTDNACFNIIDKGLSSYTGQELGNKLTFSFKVLDNKLIEWPETENHVMMIHTSQYLANQWIQQNPRGDSRLRSGKYQESYEKGEYKNEGGKLEDFLLQAAGRIVHNGPWEANGHPYQGLTTHALMNLQSYADSSKVRIAAQNALDVIATLFAAQSLESKRFGPYRRSYHYADRVSIYENDSMPFVMGALSGAYAWDNSFFATKENPAAIALWATLLNYRLPRPIHELMLNRTMRKKGTWSRIMTRFSHQHYQVGGAARYFNSDGTPFKGTKLEKLPESYFVMPTFINAAGGTYNRYPIEWDDEYVRMQKSSNTSDWFGSGASPRDSDFLSRPHAILPKGHLNHWKDKYEMQKQVALMRGNGDYWMSDNSGTYKGFSYGYYTDGDKDRHLDYPQHVPPSWAPYKYTENNGKDDQFRTDEESRVRFQFYDLRSDPNYGVYVVIARVSKSHNSSRYRNFARGFWEIVPAHRFGSAKALKDWVLANNPKRQFHETLDGKKKYYHYKMTSGETLELETTLGADTDQCDNAIRAIWAPGKDWEKDAPLKLEEYAFDRCNQAKLESAPLISVQEVDSNYTNTGRTLVTASGGSLVFTNPYIGERLKLDSKNYRAPSCTEEGTPRESSACGK